MNLKKLNLKVNTETGQIDTLILGLADDFGDVPSIDDCYDPQSRFHVKNNSFPNQFDVSAEMNALMSIFKKNNINVLRPKNINGVNQIFARDIGFVIDDYFIVANVIEDRKEEVPAINSILKSISSEKIIHLPNHAHVEGGDVVLYNEHVFVGVSSDKDFETFQVARTNYRGYEFLNNKFDKLNFHAFELNKTDLIPEDNSLHLDCCFQPIGKNKAIISPNGFKYETDVEDLINLFGQENVLLVTSKEMSNMYTNVFSINESTIISDHRFERLNDWLINNDFTVELVSYNEISKMGGLFRCSTLPLIRN